jgi:superfamily II RNA helicase
MDATLHPTDADLLRALLPLVPAAHLATLLDELGFGSVPPSRALEEALIGVLQAVPTVRQRLLAPVRVPLDRAAALLRVSPSALAQHFGAGAAAAPAEPSIAAAELLRYGARPQRPSAASAPLRYELITRAFLAGLGEAERQPLVPDPFQQAAVTASLDSDVVVVAPSGSGKTWIAERAIWRALANGQTVCYTTPLKALSNQKFRRFRALFGYHSVGLLTGERRENAGAPVVVATTEILRNQLYGQGPFPQLIILDEAHYLADPDRGSAWEEVIALAPPTSLLLLLSATISNAEVLADWMASVRPRRPELITTEVRPVPLRYGVLAEQRAVVPLGLAPYVLAPTSFHALQGHELPRLVQTLHGAQLLPAIIFWPTRRACDEAVAAFEEMVLPGARERAAAYQEWARDYPLLAAHPLRRTLIRAGVAPHHAGHLMAWRMVVEELLRAGLLSVVFATTTLAAGLDVPVRTVVLPELTVWDADGPRAMQALEFHQMVGRAGRRGKDRVGFVLLLPESQEALSAAQTLIASAAEPLHSAFHVSYGQILALLGRFPLSEARGFWDKSFAAYEQRATVLGLQRQLEALPDDPLERRPCADRLVTRRRFEALRRRLAETPDAEAAAPPIRLLRPGRLVTLDDGAAAVVLRGLPCHGEEPRRWECLTAAGARRLCAATEIRGVSARLLDMSDVRPSPHVVTPRFALSSLRPVCDDHSLPPQPGEFVRLRQPERLAIVHRVWRRGPAWVLEVVRADGRAQTCRLEHIGGRYEGEPRLPPLPLGGDLRLLEGQRVVIAGRPPNRGRLIRVEGTRLRGRAVVRLADGRQLTCGLARVRLIDAYRQEVLAPLLQQLREAARQPAAPLYEAAGSADRSRLLGRLQELPCARCALQAACESSLASLESLMQHRRSLLKAIEALQAKAGGEFDRRLRLLQRLGYVAEDGELTAVGRWAREIRHPHELVVCELLRRQLAVTATPEEFAALMAALTTERAPRRLVGHPILFGLPELLRELQRLERQHGLASPSLSAILAPTPQRWVACEADEEGDVHAVRARPSGRPPPAAGERRAACLYRWATGAPWAQLVQWAGIDEGDLERLILQTAELLQQIEHLALPTYAGLARDARQAILRPPVA